MMPIYKMDGKKDNKQKYRVRLNYIDNLGTSKQLDRVAYGLEGAKQLERELNYQTNKEAPEKALTLQELYNEYIDAKKYEVRETTLKKINQNLNIHVLPYINNIKIDNLNNQTINKWKQTIEKLELSIRTRKNIYSDFRTLLNYAVKMEYLTKNPLIKVGNFKAPLDFNKDINYYTADEFKIFSNTLKSIVTTSEEEGILYNWHYYVFFNIAFYTGLRKGEINALQWNDIKENYLSVSKSVSQKLKGVDRITPPKNKSSIRTLQLPIPLINILNEHLTRCKKIDNFSTYFFICGGERAIRDTSLENINIKICNIANIKKLRIHDFRHSHVSLLANEGINIQEIARRLGHSDIKMTWNTYSHLYPREEERAVEILNKI